MVFSQDSFFLWTDFTLSTCGWIPFLLRDLFLTKFVFSLFLWTVWIYPFFYVTSYPMREIVFDTETTGFDPSSGDRIVEIGCLELINHIPTGNTFHVYLNPEKEMTEEVINVHGLTNDFLKDKPLFKDIADDFLAFIGDALLVAHNASFDLKFVNAELSWLKKSILSDVRLIDTLVLARQKFPGAKASLNDLCRRFNIDLSKRVKHGALLDAELLAEVYLGLLGGREMSFDISIAGTPSKTEADGAAESPLSIREARLFPLTEAESKAHDTFIHTALKTPLWDSLP